MCDCSMWCNNKILEYGKCIFAFNIGTQSHGVWLVNMMQREYCKGFKIYTQVHIGTQSQAKLF